MCNRFDEAIQCFHDVKLDVGYKLFELWAKESTGDILYLPPWSSYPYEFNKDVCTFIKEKESEGDGFSFFVELKEAEHFFKNLNSCNPPINTEQAVLLFDKTTRVTNVFKGIALAEIALFNPSLVISHKLDGKRRVLGLTPKFIIKKIIETTTTNHEITKKREDHYGM